MFLSSALLLVSGAFVAPPVSHRADAAHARHRSHSCSSSSSSSSSAFGGGGQTPPSHRVARARQLVCQFGQLPGLPIPGQPKSSSTTTADGVKVDIEATGINSRCISASIIVSAAPSKVWTILTDYDNLATHVPNLVKSDLQPHPSGGIRLYQEGAQKIVGFDFRASLTMDMTERTEDRKAGSRIMFQLVESAMFANFDGEWRVQPYSRVRSRADPTKYEYKSKLSYRVNITPKGLVPVPALEWRIREDVPVNLQAVRVASEKLAAALPRAAS